MQKEKQLLEQRLTIIAQYFQPHVSYSIIRTWLDDIVQEILYRLKIRYPAHSIFSTKASKKFSIWRDNNINNNFWNQTETAQIIHILKEYMFTELGFYKLHKLFVALHLEDNKYIIYVSILDYIKNYNYTLLCAMRV